MTAGKKEKTTIVVVGPTGVGKTDLAVSLAERYDGEIVSADSRQIYRWMDVGTDKPPAEVRKRIKHYLIDAANPDEYFSAGKYARLARRAIEEIIGKGKQPIVAGGAGLYLRALIDGLFNEEIKDYDVKERLRREAEEQGTEVLYERLKSADPLMASRLRPADTQRIVRALEVHEVTGCSLSDHWMNSGEGFTGPLVFVGIDRMRNDLYQRIERRVDMMLERGLIAEVEKLRSMGYGRKLNSQLSVGYREVHEYLDEELDFDEMVRLIKQRSRNYAKRQLTWFRKDARIQWFSPEPGESSAAVLDDITRFLNE